jgi:DNA-binding beta-propeller fold protein YncE
MMRLLRLFMVLVSIIVGGCSAFRGDTFPLVDPTLHKVWPSPPEAVRIKLLRVLAGPESILPERGKVQRFFEAITGEEQLYVGFTAPAGVAVDGDRYLYIADPPARLVHRYDLQEREIGYLSLPDGEAFASPISVAVDNSGNCYVSDSVLSKVFKFNRKLELVGALGEGRVEFQRPAGIAITAEGKKYVVDVLAHKLLVFDQNDNYLEDFPAAADQDELERPINVAIAPNGYIYVTDALDFAIKVFDNSGKFVKTIGQIGDSPGAFARPKGVALDSDGHIYTVDANFDNFQIFDKEGQFLLYVGRTGKNPGEFYLPNGIFIDQKDRIYVSDSYNRRIQIFQYVKESNKKN